VVENQPGPLDAFELRPTSQVRTGPVWLDPFLDRPEFRETFQTSFKDWSKSERKKQNSEKESCWVENGSKRFGSGLKRGWFWFEKREWVGKG